MGKLRLVKHAVIFRDHHYNSFPNVIKLKGGKAIVCFRQATDRMKVFGEVSHIDPTSKAVFVTSDDGEIWSEKPQIIYDDFLYGVQDPCINVLQDGTIFVTFFMWKVLDKVDVTDTRFGDHVQYDRWVGRLDHVYSIRSRDGGKTWDEPIPLPFLSSALRGNCVEMHDGAIIAPLYGAEGDSCNVMIVRTEDCGQTWTHYSTILACDGYDFEEPNLYRTESGKIVAFIRTTSKETMDSGSNRNPLYTSESLDNGKTWSQPVRHRIYSPSPYHAVRLSSGNVLLTYGYRHRPFGIRAVLVDAECRQIDQAEETILREDGIGEDIGYTSSVQFEDGRILVTYYYYSENGERYIAGSWCEEN